jgi:hypothetical protein
LRNTSRSKLTQIPFIFIPKILKSPEDFRKNPHVKIPPKSPPTNFQSLGIFKNQIFIRKRIFLHFWPNRPSGQPTQPRPTCFPTGCSPSPHWASASRPAQLAVSAQLTARRWRPARLPPPIRQSVFLENRLPFTNAY